MMNSLCGSMGSLKKESSCSKLNQPPSPSASVSESNNVNVPTANSLPEFDPNNNPDPSSLNFQNLKFDGEEVQSPDNSIWESFFDEQIDSSTDFMIYSPKRFPDYMISSPKRDFMMTSPKRDYMMTSPKRNFNQGSNTHTYLQPIPSSSYSYPSKGKAQSPLHKVFNSPTNQYLQQDHHHHHTTSSLPPLASIDGFIDDYQDQGFGAYPSMKTSTTSVVGYSTDQTYEMPTTLSAMLEYSGSMSNSSRYSGVNEVGLSQDRDVYQLNSFASQQQQQQKQTQEQNHDHNILGIEQEEDSGLQLVHLLLACAEAVARHDYMTARRYLHQLNRIVTPLGDSMQRVASCFTDALSARLAATLTTSNPSTSTPKHFTTFPPNSIEVLKIYQIVYQACPYIKFAHFTANQAIFEAFEAEERVHVIDLDILQGYQWPAFMQALAARPGGAPFLRITGVGTPEESVTETGRCLTELAHSLQIPFEFHPVAEQLQDLKSHMLHRRVGEALAVNSANCLHRVPGSALGNLLGIIRDQAPSVFTLVEQEASHNGPYFLGRFLEALHYYSAMFDSLDATFPADSAERAKVEQYLFAPEIRNIVACEGLERVKRHERLEKWRKLMEAKGFKGVPLSANAVTQSKLLLGLYSRDGYRLTEDRGCLLLGWQDRALIAASAWRC
ncbi:hypothetical protein Sjap_023236 [Stephania japonica]|uniref:Uncharacterized protein n=1 Tax=Stephania japonica TaxID=461633 RepID=A0AAP0HKA0_9MAGN